MEHLDAAQPGSRRAPELGVSRGSRRWKKAKIAGASGDARDSYLVGQRMCVVGTDRCGAFEYGRKAGPSRRRANRLQVLLWVSPVRRKCHTACHDAGREGRPRQYGLAGARDRQVARVRDAARPRSRFTYDGQRS